jgi:hypothetical protein
MRIWAVVTFIAVLAACSKDDSSVPTQPPETAGEAMRRDNADIAKRLEEQKAAADQQFQQQRAAEERTRRVDAFNAARMKFGQTVDELYKSSRDKMAPIVKQMESVRADAAALEANACLEPGKATLLEGMDLAIAGMKQFMSETGEQSADSQEKMKNAAQKLASVDADFKKCY